MMAWYNFRTDEYDYHDQTPDDLRDYISQYPLAQDLFGLYIKMGDAPLEAMRKVLEASIGVKPEEK